jgi:proteasome lid subunit RPN8/RPN11
VIDAVVLSEDHRAQIAREARDAGPRECCGLIEGVREGDRVRVIALHPARNVADCDDGFVIDPEMQFALLRRLRGTERAIVGCYHSHPNGRAEPSARDRDGAGEAGFVWLIAAVGAGEVRLASYVFENPGFRAIPLRLAPARAPTL